MKNIKKALLLMAVSNMFANGTPFKYYESVLDDLRRDYE